MFRKGKNKVEKAVVKKAGGVVAGVVIDEFKNQVENIVAPIRLELEAEDEKARQEAERQKLEQETVEHFTVLKRKAREFKEKTETLELEVLEKLNSDTNLLVTFPAVAKDYRAFLEQTAENARNVNTAVIRLGHHRTAENVKQLEKALARAAKDYNAWNNYMEHMSDKNYSTVKSVAEGVVFELKKPLIKIGRWLSDVVGSASNYFRSAKLQEESERISEIMHQQEEQAKASGEATIRERVKGALAGAVVQAGITEYGEQEKRKIKRQQDERVEAAQRETFLGALKEASENTANTLGEVTTILDNVLHTHAAAEAGHEKRSKKAPQRAAQQPPSEAKGAVEAAIAARRRPPQ